MKIAICTIGSRGDVQPFLILGEYLAKQGHEVKVSSAKMYEALASTYEVDYVPFAGDYESIMDNSELKKKIGRNRFALGKALREQVYPIIENSLETFYQLSKWADVILYHPKTMLDGIGKEMQSKLMKAYVVPLFTPTCAFANPILLFLPLPKFLNRLTYKFANALMGSLSRPIKNFRKKKNLTQRNLMLNTPVLYGISSAFLARPTDYPKDHFFTGFWMKDNGKQTLNEEVKAFMSNDKKVLIITFGSMPYQSKIEINTFVAALTEKYKIKILVVRGWGLKDLPIKESDKVLVIDSAPFELLFPLAGYVIHHGGAGTTAIALKAGIPQMICPVLHPVGDQYFWGKQIEKMKIGVPPIPLKQLTISKLLNSFGRLQNEVFGRNAEKMRREIERENGLATAEEIIKTIYHQRSKTSN